MKKNISIMFFFMKLQPVLAHCAIPPGATQFYKIAISETAKGKIRKRRNKNMTSYCHEIFFSEIIADRREFFL